jgi:hypothetical protein
MTYEYFEYDNAPAKITKHSMPTALDVSMNEQSSEDYDCHVPRIWMCVISVSWIRKSTEMIHALWIDFQNVTDGDLWCAAECN